jgi:hypothetical protein
MTTKRFIQSLVVVLLILASIPVAQAQEPEAGEGELGYGDVITDEAITQEGVVTVHQVGDRWFLEIPSDLLGREIFWYSELAQMPASFVPLL